MFEWVYDPSAWVALCILTILEIVLGIDNIIFIGVLVNRLPESLKNRARILGLFFAMFSRLALLGFLFYISHLSFVLFTLEAGFLGLSDDFSVSFRDIVLFVGGLFLLYKSTIEINKEVFKDEKTEKLNNGFANFWLVILEIAFLDIIFSLDSVITAVGMANNIEIMCYAVIIAVFVMMFAAKFISHFIDTYPSIKILALAFLLIVGVVLIADGLHFHIPKGYIYFAMAFSLGVEVLNIIMRKNKC